MNKANLKEFAIESRKDLIERIKIKLNLYYVEERFTSKQNGDMYILINEKHVLNLTRDEYQKRELLLKRIDEIGINKVIEEAAYTWFNRLIAIRYMEVHNFLPLGKNNESLGIRVLSSNDNTPMPEILKFSNLINNQLDIKFDQNVFISLTNDNEKFKYVIQLICNKLKAVIPSVFGGLTDYIDLLIPENLLSETGFVNKLITKINEKDFSQVEIIGWLYQFYNSDVKDETFLKLQKNVKIDKEHIPAATQLFTPDWIVKYMVDNSLGKLWLSAYPNSEIKNDLEYYIENEKEKFEKSQFDIEKIKIIDPCMGSGHILIYVFELLIKMYKELGWTNEDAVNSIINNNIHGLDIDDRAAQLSNLSIILTARKYDKNIFKKYKKLNICSIKESSFMTSEFIDFLSNSDSELKNCFSMLKKDFEDAKEFGSIINVSNNNYTLLKNRLVEIQNQPSNNIFEYYFSENLTKETFDLIEQAEILIQKYEIVITNPPYMGSGGMNAKLSNYLKINYPNSKSDFFAVFMEKCSNMTKENYLYSMVTQQSWMFLESFKELRSKIVHTETIDSMIHLGVGAFKGIAGAVTTAFTIWKKSTKDINGVFLRLVDYDNEESKLNQIKNKNKANYYYATNNKFINTPNELISYWVSDNFANNFTSKNIGDYADTKKGIMTGNNTKFVRSWYEVDIDKIGFDCLNDVDINKSGKKWFPITSGGPKRKWYGNFMDVVNLENDAYEITHLKGNNYRLRDKQYYCTEAGTWSEIGGNNFSVRYVPTGISFGNGGPCCFSNLHLKYIIALLNSKVAKEYLYLLAPTVNFGPDQIKQIPLILNEGSYNKIVDLCNRNIDIMKSDWDSNETSWNFKAHPFILINNKTKNLYEMYCIILNNVKEKIMELKINEEIINDLFISEYGLENEIMKEVDLVDLSLKEVDEVKLIKSLISYFVGCLFGRYSIDSKGIKCANSKFDMNNYGVFKPDKDNIILIFDSKNNNFKDDIVGKFFEFIKVVFGEEKYSENIEYIANLLGRKGTATPEETLRKYFVNDFYSDHLKMYQKKPIYWMFDSGKNNGFKALIYIHRYNSSLISKIRVDYLHKTQDSYERRKNELIDDITNEINVKESQSMLNIITLKLEECNQYDEKIGHIANQMIDIDLDDGIKANYDKFSSILAKIK